MDMIVPYMEQSTALEPNDLRLFAQVVEWGSFSRAADHLGMPKSSVSRRIAALEERVGERLLLRTTRKLSLTEFGQGLLEHARQIDAEASAAQAFVLHRQARPSGRLRVSMSSDFANVVLVELLAAFAALHPKITLDIDLSPRRVDLIAEHFDLALRMGKLPDDATLAARRFGDFAVGLYAAPAYLAEHGFPDTPEALHRHQTLCLPGGPAGESLPWTLSRDGAHRDIAPAARFLANSPELLLRLARAGAGIAAAPEIYTPAFVARGELLRVLPDWQLPPVTGWAVFPGRRLMPAKTRAFIDMLMGCGLPRPANQAPPGLESWRP